MTTPLLTTLSQNLPAQVPLALAWIAYAVFHSFTASLWLKSIVQRRWPQFFASYRLAYNLLAGVLLLPILWLAWKTPGPTLWTWEGSMAWLMNGVTVLAMLHFLRYGSGYDLSSFLGLRPEAVAAQGRFVLSGWHRFVRHPWYALGLILIWTRDMTTAGFVTAEAITMYFVIGSRLEERKLVEEFGERYREYQRKVGRLFPLPWRVLSKTDADRLAG